MSDPTNSKEQRPAETARKGMKTVIALLIVFGPLLLGLFGVCCYIGVLMDGSSR